MTLTTYVATCPPWMRQVERLPPCTGARSSSLYAGTRGAKAAYGDTDASGLVAFAYCWRRFGPPGWGSDDHKELAQYILCTSHADIFLALGLSASPLCYAVGYLVAKSFEKDWYAPLEQWELDFERWFMTQKLPSTKGTRPKQSFVQRCWEARFNTALVNAAEAAIGVYPHARKRERHPVMQHVLHEALVELLRPVFVRDVAINILGRVADEDLDEREPAPVSDYAGYPVPKDAMDALLEEDAKG